MNTTAAIDTTPVLTLEKLIKVWETICPPLYYVTNTTIERGQMLLSKEPEFIICHPDDFGSLRERIIHRRLVHLRDRPPEEFYQDFLASEFGKSLAFIR